MALIDTARAKEKQATADSGLTDAEIDSLIDAASEYIERYCGRKFTSATFTDEVHDGQGMNTMDTDNFPIVSLTNVKVTDFGGTETTILGAQFIIDNKTGEIQFDRNGTAEFSAFPRGFQNIKITYVGGFTPVPEAVQEATAQMVAAMTGAGSNSSSTSGISSEKIGDYAISFSSSSGGSSGGSGGGGGIGVLTSSVQVLLGVYRDHRI